MKIKTELNRVDLLWMNLYLSYRLPGNWSFLFFIWLGMTGMYFYRKGLTHTPSIILENLIINAGIATASALIMFSMSVFFTVLFATKKSGVLGEHEYEIKDDGIFEITDANETLTKWNSIRAVRKSNRFILIQVNWFLFHTIPARYFESDQEYEEFYSIVSKHVSTPNMRS